MKYIDLPGTDLHVSRIAFGTWGIGGPPFWKAVEEKDAIAILHEAFDNGINFFDTAPVYGFGYAESLLKKAFANRDDVGIATKVGLRWSEETRRSIHPDLSPESITYEVEQSLKRLGRDVIDIYQVHLPDHNTAMEASFSTLRKIQEAGKIKHIGVSNYNVDMIIEAQKYADISICQPRFNYLDQKGRASLLPFCKKHQIGTLVYSPLASGLLTGKYNRDSIFDDWRSGNYADLFAPGKRENFFRQIDRLKQIAAENQVSLTRLMLEWTLHQPGVSAILTGIRKHTHLNDIIAAGDLNLDSEFIEKVTSLQNELKR